MLLEKADQETIINFNPVDPYAYIFTYDKVWQRHVENKLGILPIEINGFGGRTYKIDKKLVPKPRARRKPNKLGVTEKGVVLKRSRIRKEEE